jgi:hypothetical protein
MGAQSSLRKLVFAYTDKWWRMAPSELKKHSKSPQREGKLAIGLAQHREMVEEGEEGIGTGQVHSVPKLTCFPTIGFTISSTLNSQESLANQPSFVQFWYLE